MDQNNRIVVIGGGFAGLTAVQSLRHAPVSITLVDQRNFHLFQPLLYQVATGDLAANNIAAPLRFVLRRQSNARVIMGEVTGFNPTEKKVLLADGEIEYDTLIVAAGSDHNYYGHDEWRFHAPGLKSVEDAYEIRNRIVKAFESAEREPDPDLQKEYLSFVIIGGGSTGVELAGSIAEIAIDTIKKEFRSVDPDSWTITLLEGESRILPQYPPDLAETAVRSLEKLGITVLLNTRAVDITSDGVAIKTEHGGNFIKSRTVIWAAGIKASPIGKTLADETGVSLDRTGRVLVENDLSLKGYPDIFVIGDLAHVTDNQGRQLPGIAPVAMQEGRYVAHLIWHKLKDFTVPPFKYRDNGIMSILGRGDAIALIHGLKLSGRVAWFVWLFVHLMFIVLFGNRLLILAQWGWKYLYRSHYARLIFDWDECIRDSKSG